MERKEKVSKKTLKNCISFSIIKKIYLAVWCSKCCVSLWQMCVRRCCVIFYTHKTFCMWDRKLNDGAEYPLSCVIFFSPDFFKSLFHKAHSSRVYPYCSPCPVGHCRVPFFYCWECYFITKPYSKLFSLTCLQLTLMKLLTHINLFIR